MVAMDEQAYTQAAWQYSHVPSMDGLLFQQWVELLEKRTGIALPESRKTFLLTNLHARMREVGCDSYQKYFHLVTDGSRGQVEWEVLIDRLTVHETRFFRDSHALDLVREVFLPALIEKVSIPYTVHAWSVGCATGEEPYSLAIVMEEFSKRHEKFYYGVTASDVSRASLQTGRNAIYHIRRIKNVPSAIVNNYLTLVDDEHAQVESNLRQKVCFSHLNLLALESLPTGMMDLILCQNVLIYFKRELRIEILNRLVERLKPGGMIVLGAGEVFGWTHPELELVNYESTLAFQRHPVFEGTV